MVSQIHSLAAKKVQRARQAIRKTRNIRILLRVTLEEAIGMQSLFLSGLFI